jgi:hypothetical protein
LLLGVRVETRDHFDLAVSFSWRPLKASEVIAARVTPLCASSSWEKTHMSARNDESMAW